MKNEEIKEILDSFTKFKDKWYSCEYILKPEQCILLLDYITNLQQENEKLKYNARGQVNDYFKDKYADEVLKNAELTKENEKEKQFIKDCGFQNQQQLVLAYLDYKSRCENTDKIMYKFEEWLKSNFWNDDEGNESYQIEKYTTFYSVYRKLDLLKTLNKGDVNETNS